MLLHLFLGSALPLLATARPQLVVPTPVPVVTDNFRLVASSNATRNPLQGSVNDLEVASLPDKGCALPFILVNASTTPSSTFYFDAKTKTVRLSSDSRAVVLQQGTPDEVVLSCNEPGTSGLGVDWLPAGPQLHLDDDGQFYACQRQNGATSVTQVFYDKGAVKPLPDLCIPMTLFAKVADGKSHGPDSVVSACEDVKDGSCVLSSQ